MAGVVYADPAIDYDQNTSPSVSDELLGIDDPSGSWSVNRFPISDIFDLYGLVTSKFDATEAPDADNDVDEGYEPGSLWVDVTNDLFYICVDATDGAAVWLVPLYTDSILDEDNMTTDSAVYPPTQQSTKAYVDATVPPIECVIESLADADDGKGLFHAHAAITLTHVGIACEGDCTTVPTITFQDGAGTQINTDAITIAKDTVSNGVITYAAVTSGGALVEGEKVEIKEVGATIDPETDTYFFSFKYTVTH